MVQNVCWGHIGFDNCGEPRLHDEAEIAILQVAAESMAAAIARQARDEELRERSQQLESLNTELQQTVDSLENRDRILAATAKASNILLTGKDFDKSVNQALQIIGDSISTDRIGIIENFDNPEDTLHLYWKMSYEWSSAYAVSQLNCLEVLQGSYEGIEEWDELLTQGESISCQLGEMSEPFRSEMAKIGVKTLYVVPILREGKYWGSIGIDDCREETHRSETELSILKTAAVCIGSAIERDRAQKAILKAEQKRVAELAKTNQVLKNSLDRLADEPDLDSFLGHILTEISQQLQIDLGYLFFYNPRDRALDLHMQVTPTGTSLKHELSKTNPFRKTFSVEDLPIWDTLLETQKPFIINRENAAQYVFHGAFEWQTQQQKHHTGINLLLTIKNEPIGLLALVSTKHDFNSQEIEVAQALAQQAILAIKLTQLAEKTKISAIIGERNQIAREIHDTLGQSFTAIVLQIEAGKRLLTAKPEQVDSCLSRAQDLAHQGIIQVQRSLWTLREKANEYRDLTAAFQRLVASLNTNITVEIKFTSFGTQPVLPANVSFNLLRIGQEALTNALKHSSAQRIDLNLIFTSDHLELQVRDDGRGFAIEILAVNSGFGIKSIQQRAEQINAEVDIITSSGKGTSIIVNVPLTTIQ